MLTSISDTVRVLFHQKGISEELVLKAVEESLIAAYKKKFGTDENAVTKIDKENLEVNLYSNKEVVESVIDDLFEISLNDAEKYKKDCKIHDEILIKIDPAKLGRIAVQTARQVMMNKLKGIERNITYNEYKDKIGQIVTGYFRRSRNRNILIDLGKVEAILPFKEQSQLEVFTVGERVKAVIIDVKNFNHSTEVVVSRASHLFVQRLFENDIPELEDHSVEIKSIVRQPGYRTKIAVSSDIVDPVGACVGMKGMRIHNIIKELEGEKIDIILYQNNIKDYIANSLAPAKVKYIIITDEQKCISTAVVEKEQLSLAIGKQGYNVKLASKMTGWHIDIKTQDQLTEKECANEPRKLAEDLFSDDNNEELHSILEIDDIDRELREIIYKSGIESLEELVEKNKESLIKIKDITEEQVNQILLWIKDNVVVMDKDEDQVNKEESNDNSNSKENNNIIDSEDYDKYIYTCPECNKEVELNISNCPGCGIELSFE